MSISVFKKITGINGGVTGSVDNIWRQVNGGGFAITTGVKGYLIVPFDCTWTSTEAIGDVAGNTAITIGTTACNWTFAAPLAGKQTFNNADVTLTRGDILPINVIANAGAVTRIDFNMILTRT